MRNQIEFRHLRYFLVLSDTLHYRKAAEQLFISQSGLSKQIQQLEDLLEVQLFERDKKKVRLTKGGIYLKEQASFLQGYLESTFLRLKAIEEGLDGEIKIGFVGSAMQNVIPELLIKSNEIYPNIRFNLDEMSNQAQLEAIQNNSIDLGFVRLNAAPPSIQLKEIFKEHFSLVLPYHHPINPSNFKTLSQLVMDHFILFSSDYSSTYYNKIMSIFSDAGFQPKISHKSIHANTIFRIVESGLGVAIVPHSLTLGIQLKIKILKLTKIRQRAILSIAWKKKNQDPSLKKILDLLPPFF